MFEGVFVALITPFRAGQVDVDALGRLIEYQIQGGVGGIVPCGTTGESATLSHAEHKEVIQRCVDKVAGRVPVVAGTGSNSTSESIDLTRAAKKAGADGALLITPYYNKPTQEGLFRHYQAVAEAVDLPIVLYNVPGRTAVDMQVDTITRLSRIPNITAIKEATANLERASQIHLSCGDDLTLMSGDDATFLPFLAVGGSGVISVAANIIPSAVSVLWRAWKKGDKTAAYHQHNKLLKLNSLLFCETNPIPIKAAAAMLGLCGPDIRLPLTPLSAPFRDPLRQELITLSLLPPANGPI